MKNAILFCMLFPFCLTGDIAQAEACYLKADGEFLDWSGQCNDGKADGNGKATASDGVTYTGSAKDGKPHGYGSVTSSSGQLLYQGRYRDGVPHGKGIVLGEDGKYYLAEFEVGKQVGDEKLMPGVAAEEPRRSALETGADDSGLEEISSYDAALKAHDGGDGVVRVVIPEDDYGAKLAELERREAERRATEQAREAEHYAKEIRREIEEERAAERRAIFKEKKKRRDERLLQMGIEAGQRIAAPVETNIPGKSTSDDKLQKALKKTMQAIQRFNQKRERQRREYERQRALERQRKTRPNTGRDCGGSGGTGGRGGGSVC